MQAYTITIILVAALVACVLAHENVDKIVEECQNEAKVPEEERESSFKNSRFDPKNASKSVKCAHKCFMEKSEILKNDQLNGDKILELATNSNADNVRQVIEKCNRETGIDDCDAVYQKALCLQNELGSNSGISTK